MRMMFISPRPYGAIATPGTYLSVEAYAKFFDVHLICSRRRERDIIVFEKRGTFLTTEISFQESVPVASMAKKLQQFYKNITQAPHKLSLQKELPWLETTLELMLNFNPDLVVFPAWKHTPRCILAVKKILPNVSIFVEVKSPLLAKNERYIEKVRSIYERVQKDIAGIIGPSLGMIQSAIPAKITQPVLTHRSIINYHGIEKKQFPNEIVPCIKFIFAGSLEDVRQIDVFIRLMARLPNSVLNAVNINIFGDGGSRDKLESLVEELGLGQTVHFLGVISQEALLKQYKDHDVGLAWVPQEFFAKTPSLKLIEYCAAGLVPLATDNDGHKILSEKGFHIEYFTEEDPESFVTAIGKLVAKGYSADKLRNNIELASSYDYTNVIEQEIIPFYKEVLARDKKEIKV
jgi:glycosyltransferase involved in cell wall biosynthesis